MKSSPKIRTTHVGSLPRPDGPWSDDTAAVRAAVRGVIHKQREIGVDVVNDGEYAKGGDWLSYAEDRLDGFEDRTAAGLPMFARGADREAFPAFYRYLTERNNAAPLPGRPEGGPRRQFVCTGPIAYRGTAALQRELDAVRAGVTDPSSVFITSTAPASLEAYRTNAFYATPEEFVFALADALRVEYEMIVDAGFLVQVDDAWLVAMWDRIGIAMGLEKFLAWCTLRIEALNYALRNIPEDRIRYHLCWGSWHGPHAHDLEMRHMLDVLLKVKTGYYLFEAANARHEHEYAVWRGVTLPPGRCIVPGVVSHATDVVEHPELVADRIRRFVDAVGADRVLAGTDCGFGGRLHPEIAWAKLQSLVEGARLASS
jgi:5-methyltetrahydropteroyltriglutamate--homocysteine methyltransferase